MTIRITPQLLTAIMHNGLNTKQLKNLGYTSDELNVISGDVGFKLSDHARLASQLWKGAKGKTHFDVSYMHIGMIKYIMRYISGESIAYFTGLNRMWLSRVKSGQYADNVQPIPCTLKNLIDNLDPIETEYNARLFSAKRVLQVMHRLGITSKQAAQELDIAEKYVRRYYFEFENN